MNTSYLSLMLLLGGGMMTAHSTHHETQIHLSRVATQDYENKKIIHDRVGILITMTIENPTKLHPRNALRLLIVLIERYLAIERRQDLEEYYILLQNFLHKNSQDARAILEAIAMKTPQDIIPNDVCEKLNKLTNFQKLQILSVIQAQLCKNHPQDNIEHLENLMFSSR